MHSRWLAYFLWTWYEFGITSCFHENLPALWAKGLSWCFFASSLQLRHLSSLCPVNPNGIIHEGSNIRGTDGKSSKEMEEGCKGEEEAEETRRGRYCISIIRFNNIMSSPGETTSPSHGSSPFHLLHRFTHSSTDSAPNPTLQDLITYLIKLLFSLKALCWFPAMITTNQLQDQYHPTTLIQEMY